jgi:hypothetical protein
LSDVEVADSSQEWEADAAEYEPECGRGKDSQEHCAEADRQFQLLQTEPGFIKEQRGPEGAGESTGEQQQSVGERIAANAETHLLKESGDVAGEWWW